MSKSIKLRNNTYLSSKSIVHGKKTLSERLKNQDTFILSGSYNESIPQFFLIAKLPLSNNGTSSILRINGFLGSWTSNEKAIIDVLIANRDGLNTYGTYIGMEKAFENTDIRIYEQSNGEHWVYLVKKVSYTGGIVLGVSGTNVLSIDCNIIPQIPKGTVKIAVNSTTLTKLNK